MNTFISRFTHGRNLIQSSFLPSITSTVFHSTPTSTFSTPKYIQNPSLNASVLSPIQNAMFQVQSRSIIQLKTILQVQDNSGAIEVECVTVPKHKRGHAKIGSLIVVVVKKARPNRKVKKKQVCHAIVTQTKVFKQRSNGITYASGENRCVIVDNKLAPVGTRIFGSIPAELRGQYYAKVVALANAVF